ncbi:MAG: WD40 repeat domain-containing protein, partial [Desulfobacterales bacterium]|nr:WD40 repeat domain-containing protein [Desulfobacterales bacterium]
MFFRSRSHCSKWLFISLTLISLTLTSVCFAWRPPARYIHSVEEFVPETFMLSQDESVSLMRGEGWNSWRGIPKTIKASKIISIGKTGKYCATGDVFWEFPKDVFDLATGKSILQWDHCTHLTFSPDETCLVSALNEAVTLHDLPSGKVRWTQEFETIQNEYYFSGDSKYLVIMDIEASNGGSHCTYRVYDAATGEFKTSFQGKFQTKPVFSPDGEWCAVIRPDGQAYRIWLDGSRQEPPFGRKALTLALAPDGNQLAYIESDSTLVIRNLALGKVLWTMKEIPSVVQMDFSSSGSYLTLITGKKYGNHPPSLSIFDAQNGTILEADTMSETRVPFMAVPLPNDCIAYVNGKTLQAYELNSLNPAKARAELAALDWDDAEAVWDFYWYFHRIDTTNGLLGKVTDTLVRDNTFDLMVRAEECLSDPAARETLQQAIYGWVVKLKNIPGYVWFMENYPQYAKSHNVLEALHQRAFALAEDEDTLEAYNDFVIAYPCADLAKEAQERAYALEKKKYTGWLSNSEKNARALLIKSKRMERQMNE